MSIWKHTHQKSIYDIIEKKTDDYFENTDRKVFRIQSDYINREEEIDDYDE